MKIKPKHLKSFWNKKNILLISLILSVVLFAGVTVAWLTGYDNDVDYLFEGAIVDCGVEETFNGSVKSEVVIKNTGNVDAYFRATYTVNWVKDGTQNGTPVVYPKAPAEGTDYTVSLNNQWINYGDGYYYWIAAEVAPNATSPVFIHNLTDNNTAPEGYHLQVTVLAEALQATGGDEKSFWDTWGTTFQTSQSHPSKP